eukprot:TRINITY_DN50012_c0_g1_i1.p1 TRINITY_DN50012_c0_g1~~TRINITY_DN50012_c0_g1_i1.p1  ORF type:complete len:348 (-),score=50.32 TRINITY_DN50012_c0_g1_i1:46-987(-)
MSVFSLVLASPLKPHPKPCEAHCQRLFIDVAVMCVSGLIGAATFLGLGKLMEWTFNPDHAPYSIDCIATPESRKSSKRSNLFPMASEPLLKAGPVQKCPIASLQPLRHSLPEEFAFSLDSPVSDERKGNENTQESQHGGKVALAIWLGMLLDGIPESIMLGFLTNKGDITMAFVVAIFVANFPESFSGASLLKKQGMQTWKIYVLWFTIFWITGILAAVGSLAMPKSDVPEVVHMDNIFDALSQGLAGGMMLAMVATAMLPEAFKGAGESAGVYFVLGFVLSLSITCFEARFGTVQSVRPGTLHELFNSTSTK